MPDSDFTPIRLCALDELTDGVDREGREFKPFADSRETIFVIREAGSVVGYLNVCPHIGSPLNWSPDRFLDMNKEFIICSTHGARFRREDGVCISGPCEGDALTGIALEVREGAVYLVDRPE